MRKNKVIAFILINYIVFGLCAACFTGCAPKDLLDPSEYEGEIWSAPPTVKVELDDTGYNQKGAPAIDISAVKNEYESYQLFITPKEKVDSFYLFADDLSDGNGNNLSKSTVTIYYQKYVSAYLEEVPYKKGWYSDPLIPIDKVKDAGELSIGENQNGALWITYYIPKDTVAGVYTGTFSLEIKDRCYAIPVTVRVYDYTLTDEIHFASNFSIRQMLMACGELDSSVEMREKYYDFFLEYRTSLRFLPAETGTTAERVEAAKRYFDKTTGYTIYPEDILSFAEASTPEKNLLSKAYLYFLGENYMHYSDGSTGIFDYFNPILVALKEELQSYVDTISSDTSGKYDSFKQIENWQDYILNILNVVPDLFDRMIRNGDYDDPKVVEYLSLVNGYCTIWNVYDDQFRDKYLEILESNDASPWWYGCLAPKAPYATYHIADTNLLSARTISWLAKKYDIRGNIYWCTASYASESDRDPNIPDGNVYSVNVYNNIYRLQSGNPWTDLPAGDGHLTYPGAAYGVYGPLPSIRLMSIRDGMEEYELLLDLENKYKAIIDDYSSVHGESIDIDALMEELYRDVYYFGAKLKADGKWGFDFTRVRNALLNALCAAEDPCRFLMHSGIAPMQNKAAITLYAGSGYTLKVNGNALEPAQGSGVKYVYELDLGQNCSVNVEVKHSQSGKTYNYRRFISVPFEPLLGFDTFSAVPQNITVTDTSAIDLNEDAQYSDIDKSLKFTVKSVFTGNPSEDMTFTPSMRIPVSLFERQVNFAGISTLYFYIYNPGDKYEMTVKLYSGSSNVICGKFTVVPGKNEIIVSIEEVKFSKLNQVDAIAIEFENEGTQSDPKEYLGYLDSMFAFMKQ